MNFFKTLLCLLILIFSFNVHAAIFKCTTSNGEIKYQGKPCDNETEKSETVKTQTKEPPIKRITEEHKKLLSIYTSMENQKAVLRACNSESLSQAYNRFNTIYKKSIQKGKAIHRRGFKGLTSRQISKVMSDAQSKFRAEYSSASASEKENICGKYEADLRLASSSSVRERNSEYVSDFDFEEGDLDSEGND